MACHIWRTSSRPSSTRRRTSQKAQLLLAGKITGQQAAQASEQIAARIRRTNRDLIANFATWSKSFK